MLQRDLPVVIVRVTMVLLLLFSLNLKWPQIFVCTFVADTILSVNHQTGLSVGECLIFGGCGIKRVNGTVTYCDKVYTC